MIKAKKSLGQNFLIDNNIINKIVNVINVKGKNTLEIGPGSGNLTNAILNKDPKELIVIEKDESLVSMLDQKFKKRIIIINNDVLKINEKELSKDKLIVFGNLPYNISTEILCNWIINLEKEKFWFECLILMFQKEVADRIISKVNTSLYGRLSILTNWKLDIIKICDVKASSFSPKPKIDSTVLFFRPKKKFLKIGNPKNLEIITRTFFNQRRKMIKKPFNQLFNGNEKIIKKLKIDLNLRPQNLDCETYYNLANEYETLRS